MGTRLQLRGHSHSEIDRGQAKASCHRLRRDVRAERVAGDVAFHSQSRATGHLRDGNFGGGYRAVGFESALARFAAGDTAGTGSRVITDLRQRRFHKLFERTIAESAPWLGRAGDSACED